MQEGKEIQALIGNETNKMHSAHAPHGTTGVHVKSLHVFLMMKGLCLEIQ